MKRYRLEAEAAVELDVEAAFAWYEAEEAKLGFDFLEQLQTVYQRILQNPLSYKSFVWELDEP